MSGGARALSQPAGRLAAAAAALTLPPIPHHPPLSLSRPLRSIQNVSFKFIELLSVMFSRSPDDMIRQQITYRYNAQKTRVATMQARLHDVVSIVKVKNPSLLLQLQQTVKPGAAAAAAAAAAAGGAGATPRR